MTDSKSRASQIPLAEPGARPASNEGNSRALTEADINYLMHNINQPLAAINNYAQAGAHMIANDMADLDCLLELFEKIIAQSTLSFEISQQLKHLIDASKGR